MKELIMRMIKYAHNQGEYKGFEFMEYIRELLEILSQTINAPSNWREIGINIAEEWNHGTFEYSDEWVFNTLELSNFGADECYGVATFDVHQEEGE